MALFKQTRGIVVACDVPDVVALGKLIKATAGLPCIAGYKVGMELTVKYGLLKVARAIVDVTDKAIIYDHQKFGTDIPEICGGKVLGVMSRAGVKGVIIFPLSGIETLKASIEGCEARGLVPIVGGEMTHKGYLIGEGGYIENGGPERIYRDSAERGVSHFVVPGTRLESIRKHRKIVESLVQQPVFLMPGIGKGQGGDIVEAFRAVDPHRAFAIVGRGIYAEPDPSEAATRLWTSVVAQFGAA